MHTDRQHANSLTLIPIIMKSVKEQSAIDSTGIYPPPPLFRELPVQGYFTSIKHFDQRNYPFLLHKCIFCSSQYANVGEGKLNCEAIVNAGEGGGGLTAKQKRKSLLL